MFRLISTLLFTSMLLITTNAAAEQKQTVGNYEIHYMAVASTFITPEVAKNYGITRSAYNGLINISVLSTSQEGNPAVAAEISGVANNLLDARKDLEFREIREGNAIYYIAEVPYNDDQEINFKLVVKHAKKLNTSLVFKQKFYVE